MTFEPEFDHVYTMTVNGLIGQGYGEYVPRVEHDDIHDILLDGQPLGSGDWLALTGYTGQYTYTGAVMHPSEQWGEWARTALSDLADTPEPSAVLFAIVAVEAPCSPDEPCFPDDPTYCERTGCSAEPAGWAVLYRVIPLTTP